MAALWHGGRVPRPSDRALAVVAVTGQVLFTAAWLALGAAARHEPLDDTISDLAAVGSAVAAPMLVGFAAQGAGQLANAALAARRGHRWLASALAVTATATLVTGALRLPGPDGAPTWVASGHTLAAVVAFSALHATVLLGALARDLPRWSRVAAAGALVVAVPHTAWLVVLLGDGRDELVGYTEKAMTLALVAWTAALPVVLAGLRPPGGGARTG